MWPTRHRSHSGPLAIGSHSQVPVSWSHDPTLPKGWHLHAETHTHTQSAWKFLSCSYLQLVEIIIYTQAGAPLLRMTTGQIKLFGHPDNPWGHPASGWRSHVCSDHNVDPPHFLCIRTDRSERHTDRRHVNQLDCSYMLKHITITWYDIIIPKLLRHFTQCRFISKGPDQNNIIN